MLVVEFRGKSVILKFKECWRERVMTNTIREFLGMKHITKNDADRLLDSVFELLFKGFEKYFSLDIQEYRNVDHFFKDLAVKHPDYSYVSEWYFEKGLEFLKNMDSDLSQVPDIIAFLEHEKFCLEIDVNEGNRTDFLFAYTEVFPMISNYIGDFYKEKLNEHIFDVQEKKISIPGLSSIRANNTSSWSVTNTQSSADKEAGLLLYA